MRTPARHAAAAVFSLAALLAACGGGSETPASASPEASRGQVSTGGAAAKVSFYAASRFAEQATFGPTPALIDELRSKGFEKWIDEQQAMAPTLIDVKPAEDWSDPTPQSVHVYRERELLRVMLVVPDQLRTRVSWSLSQFLVVSNRKAEAAGLLRWANLLQQQAFGRYDQLLYELSVHPAMGNYLDNVQNRPKSTECPHCAPNENFARELMQLFSLGVYKLNPDGTAQRDRRGRFIETYTQRDVEEMARVLTGWQYDPDPPNRPNKNWGNWAKPMVPSTWPPERDAGQKTVLGKTFAAGRPAPDDLRDAIALLMSHQNIAPFVATRLIQHLVKSNPTPAYVGRIAAVFRDNGKGVAGDLKAVVKAVLLDAEARAGDNPAVARTDDGKLREPVLHRTAVMRMLGCKRPFENRWGVIRPALQNPYNAESVFSFYAPTDRAPGSNLLAPEQKLLNADELTQRMGHWNWVRWNDVTRTNDRTVLTDAGCDIEPLVKAFATSPRVFADHLSERYFRGAMPPTLRSNLEQLMKDAPWDARNPDDGALWLLGYATNTPYFGVIK
ncbi:DUF1800 domain-containing protein [Aquabacterium humicola]|uniref:DUF1800 domain-containing protein n=1 Tax=Aquabacterium humicola TaxID=3237377 RepID=UPI002542D807|nr:DUF1800 family protein [Rubrivivax pictus]